MIFQLRHHKFLCLRRNVSIVINAIQQKFCAKVWRHNQNGVFEIHRTALWIRDSSIIQHLQQNIKHIRMCLFNLIKKDNWIWSAAHGLGQLSALFITNISRRRSNQTGHGIFLHIFTHVDTNHIGFIVKQTLGKALCQLGFTNTGRSHKEKWTNRLSRVFNACFGTNNRICHFCHTIILSNHSLMKFIIQMQCLISLRLC